MKNYKNYKYIVLQTPDGHLCGYVKFPEGNSLEDCSLVINERQKLTQPEEVEKKCKRVINQLIRLFSL